MSLIAEIDIVKPYTRAVDSRVRDLNLRVIVRTTDVQPTTLYLPDVYSDEFKRKVRQKREALDTIARLDDNWDGYDSDAPNESAYSNASGFFSETIRRGVLPNLISPSPDGGIAFEFRRRNRYYLVEFFNDGDMIFLSRNVDGTANSHSMAEADRDRNITLIQYGL